MKYKIQCKRYANEDCLGINASQRINQDLINKILAINGVAKCLLFKHDDPYELHLMKGKLFSWDDLIPKIEEVFKKANYPQTPNPLPPNILSLVEECGTSLTSERAKQVSEIAINSWPHKKINENKWQYRYQVVIRFKEHNDVHLGHKTCNKKQVIKMQRKATRKLGNFLMNV